MKEDDRNFYINVIQMYICIDIDIIINQYRD